ncbi:MAG: RNA 2',3'-cyclic phosphodiesterase [Candidatus ainarchaeum sp.]|nr:RNA 2',3'-cyclic phosphodiesterase [Candidatus ainarchaeum sp.]
MRAFIAVPVGDEVKRKIAPFSKALGLEGVTVVPEKNLHVTLFFLGEIDDKRAGEAASALEKISVPRFEARFRGAGAFPNENFIRVVWVGCESPELGRVYDGLSPAVKRMGYAVEPFRPHVTVARVKAPAAKPAVQEALKKFGGKDFGSSAVEKVALYESRLSPKGPAYEEVFAKTLCGP